MGKAPKLQVLSSQASLKHGFETARLPYDPSGLFRLFVSTCGHSSEEVLIGRSDNASVTLGEVEIRPNPNLWFAAFDPASGLEQALDSGYSPLNRIDANGMSHINLDLDLRHSLNGSQIYSYSASDSTAYGIQKLIHTFRSIYLDDPVSKSGLRYQHKCHRPMYYNFVYTVQELDSNDYDAKASHDLDGKYHHSASR